MKENAMQREVCEPKWYRVRVSDTMMVVGEEEACFNIKTRHLGIIAGRGTYAYACLCA